MIWQLTAGIGCCYIVSQTISILKGLFYFMKARIRIAKATTPEDSDGIKIYRESGEALLADECHYGGGQIP
jgi:hypothetical protein